MLQLYTVLNDPASVSTTNQPRRIHFAKLFPEFYTDHQPYDRCEQRLKSACQRERELRDAPQYRAFG